MLKMLVLVIFMKNKINEYLTCPQCKRYNALEHRGNGLFYCIWNDCYYMTHISEYTEPKINLNRFKKFRDSIKVKTSVME